MLQRLAELAAASRVSGENAVIHVFGQRSSDPVALHNSCTTLQRFLANSPFFVLELDV